MDAMNGIAPVPPRSKDPDNAVDFRPQSSWRGLRPKARSVHDPRHHPANALGGGLDVPVADVRVAQRHLHLGVAEQTRHHKDRRAVVRGRGGSPRALTQG